MVTKPSGKTGTKFSTDMVAERYSRQIMLAEIGEEGQTRLANSRVLIVGVGGLGSPVALYLAGAGVGTIGLVDDDVVSESNLQRQVLYEQSQIGQLKVEMAARRLRNLNPHCRIETHAGRLDADNANGLIAGYDLVIDCSDNYATRYLIDDVCTALGKTWVYGSIGQFSGQVTVFTTDCSMRYADLYAEREALCSMPKRIEGVIGAVPGVIGSIQASEAIKTIVGIKDILAGRLFTIDLLTMTTNIIEL